MIYLITSAGFAGAASIVGLYIFFICVSRAINKELKTKFIMVLAYCIVTTFFSPNTSINMLAAFLTVPLFARKRVDIAPIYVFSFLLLPGITLPINAGGTYLLLLSNTICVTAGAALTAVFKKKVSSQSISVPGLCLFAIFAVYTLSGFRATTPTNMLRVLLEQVFTFILPYYAIRRSVHSGDDVKRVLIGIVAATAALSTLALYEAKSTWPLYRVIYDHYGISLGSGASVKIRGGLLRSPGPFPEPTSFAFWLSLGTFVALQSRWMFRSKAKYFTLCAMLFAGLYAPQSRGAWLGLLAAYVIYQIGTGHFSKMIKGLFVVGAAGIFVYSAALTIPMVSQTLGLDQTGTIKRDYRQDLWTRGIEESKNNLLLGTDINSVLYSLRDMKQGEGIVDFVNTYLFVLLVSGLIGLSVFIISLFAPIIILWRRAKLLRRYDTRQLSVIAALLGSIACMLVFTALVGRSTMGLGIILALAAALSKMRSTSLNTVKSGIGTRRPVRETLRNESSLVSLH